MTPLDGLGVYNALHEYALQKKGNSRYDRQPGPMVFWATKNKTADLPDFKVEVVQYHTDSDLNGYEHGIGWTGGCYLVFKVTPKNGAPDQFYKLEGTVDSYDGEHWDGKFLPVTPRVENVTVYRWEG